MPVPTLRQTKDISFAKIREKEGKMAKGRCFVTMRKRVEVKQEEVRSDALLPRPGL